MVFHHLLELGNILRLRKQDACRLLRAFLYPIDNDIRDGRKRQYHGQRDQFHLVLIEEHLQRRRFL